MDPAKYKNIFHGFKLTVREDGFRGLAKGWAPTFVGYSLQGLGKFGFYEVFKILYANMLGEVSTAEHCHVPGATVVVPGATVVVPWAIVVVPVGSVPWELTSFYCTGECLLVAYLPVFGGIRQC